VHADVKGQVERSSAVLLCLALLLTSSSGAVWCRGEDGHVRLERGGDSCCEHTVGRVAVGAAPCKGQSLCTDVAHLEGCGNCVDVPLTLGVDRARTAVATVALAVLPTPTPRGHAPTLELVFPIAVPTPLRGPAASQSVLRL
jgi:hypothetical protein